MSDRDQSVDGDSEPSTSCGGPFVAFSEISVPASGASALLQAFSGRIREVEDWPGFDRLEVWRDERDETRFVMVSWWASQESFLTYMRSDSHRRSHERIPDGQNRPHPASFTRFQVVAR